MIRLSAAPRGAAALARALVFACAALALSGCAERLERGFEHVLDRATDAADFKAGAFGDPRLRLELSRRPAGVAVIETASAGLLSPRDLLVRLERDDVELILLGETHDAPQHHEIQTWIVESLNQLRQRSDFVPFDLFRGVGGLAFEMIEEEKETTVNRRRNWPTGITPKLRPQKTLEIGAAVGWEENGWPAFEMYAPIFQAAPQAYVAGGFLPRAALRDVSAPGVPLSRFLGEVTDQELYGLDAPLDPAEQALRERLQQEAHCGVLPPAALPKIVAAQRARDARLAAALLRARRFGQGLSLMIAGSGHARTDWGAPRYLRRVAPKRGLVSIGMFEVDPAELSFGRPNLVDRRRRLVDAPRMLARIAARHGVETAPFDYVILTPARADKGDPCAAFKAARKG